MEIPRPAPGDHADYMGAYIELVPDGPILRTLAEQIDDFAERLLAAGEPFGDQRYAPGKWSAKEVVGHLADTERVFAYRALRFARGDATPLPGFEQDDWVPLSGCAGRTLGDLVSELWGVRTASLTLFAGLPAEAWERAGVASGHRMTVAAVPWILAGHERHHRRILEQRYGL